MTAYLTLRTDWGKERAVDYISRLLTRELGTDVKVGDVEFHPFETLGLEDVLILDHHSDSLLFIQDLHSNIGLFTLKDKIFNLERIEFRNGLIRIIRYPGEDQDNIQSIIDKLSPEDSDKEKWEFSIESVGMFNMRMQRFDLNDETKNPGVFDASHISLSKLNAELDEIELLEGGVRIRTSELSLEEHSGLRINRLDSKLHITGEQVDISDMILETAGSALYGAISIDYSSPGSDELLIDANLDHSQLEVSDLRYFIPEYGGVNGSINLEAKIIGQLKDLLVQEASVGFGRGSTMYMDGRLRGLPNIDSLWIGADIRRFESEVNDLKYLPVPGMKDQIAKLPEMADRIGRFRFDGNFTGYLEDFSSDGVLNTEIGEAQARIDVRIGQDNQDNIYDGLLTFKEIDLGHLLENKDLGTASSSLDLLVQGKGDDFKADVEGAVGHIHFKGYDYKNITVDGKLEEDLFNGFLSIRQPEADFDFEGLVDMRTSVPKFDFKATLFQADLRRIGFLDVEENNSLTGAFIAEFEGDDIDEFDGSFLAKGLSYCKDGEEFFFEDIAIFSNASERGRRVELKSSVLDASLEGKFRFNNLKEDMIVLFDEVMPSLYPEDYAGELRTSKFDFHLQFKNSTQLTKALLPSLSISVGTQIHGKLDSEKKDFSLKLDSKALNYNAIDLNGVVLDLQREEDIAYLSLTTDDMRWGDSLRFVDNFYTLNAYRDSLETDFTWTLADKDASGSISALSIFYSADSVLTQLFPSQMLMSGDYWLTQGMSDFLYYEGQLGIGPLVISSGKERIAIEGLVSKSPESRIDFEIQDFELVHVNKFLPEEVVQLDGSTNITGYATSIIGKPTVVADMRISDFRLASERIGDVDLHSTWNKGKEYIEIFGALDNKETREIYVEGKYFPVAKGDNLNAKLIFDKFNLAILNGIPSSGISNLSGRASGELFVKGSPIEPLITGSLSFDKATVKVNYLNTSYSFSDKVIVRENFIGTNFIPFSDQYGNSGFLNGTVAHTNYKDWNYDVFAEFENMLVLNTNSSMNDKFYGKVFGTGSVSLSGYDNNLTIEVFGQTDKGTVLELPLGSRSDVVLEDFVYFKRTAEEDSMLRSEGRPTTGIELYLEADVTPDAKLKLIFDEKIGDVMEGSGEGVLTMTLNRAGEFEMYGNYDITQGQYLFTLQNIVNKRFSVKAGSTVSFFGDPYAAEFDLKTIYKLRASLVDLLSEYGELYGTRVPIEVQMALDGPLLNPDIGFEIAFPGLDSGTETVAQSKLNTEEELSRQVFSLLVLNKFLSSDPATVDDGIAGAANTGTEFASAQLSNWLSQISDDVDVGVNYRAGDNITSEELAVALTTQLFNDRLLLSGNFGVQSSSPNSVDGTSSIIGDFRLEYVITKDGKLRLKVFNETNDNTVLNIEQAATKQGVGLIFQREFDGLFDDLQKN